MSRYAHASGPTTNLSHTGRSDRGRPGVKHEHDDPQMLRAEEQLWALRYKEQNPFREEEAARHSRQLNGSYGTTMAYGLEKVSSFRSGQRKTFAMWVNQKLIMGGHSPISVDNLAEEFKDGV